MTLEKFFNASDVIKSYQWLGHQDHGYTELLALHHAYKPGKGNYKHNVKNKAFPKVWYVKSEKQILLFLSKYHGSHLCCYSVNPRSEVFKGPKGSPRCARDADIAIVNNFYQDIDLVDGFNKDKQLMILNEFFVGIDKYLAEKDIRKPVQAFSGNGYHLLFALPPIKTEEHNDISKRVNTFLKELHGNFASDIDDIGIKLDKTTDLSRVVKIYGTRKPGKTQISRFYGCKRIEDNVLLEYLLSLSIETKPLDVNPNNREMKISTYESLPKDIQKMIENDPELAHLWNSVNKTSGDTTRTGYDMSLMHAFIRRGITDTKILATILTNRPNGAIKCSGKGDEYIRLTITKALQALSR